MAIEHRLACGLLFQIYAGVYSLMPPESLPRMGRWTAAVFACGPKAALSDESAGRKRSLLPNDTVIRDKIRVTSTNCTLVALAARFPTSQIETAISKACFLERTTPEQLLRYLDTIGNRKGVAPMRKLLERHLFSMTQTELEYRFKAIARAAGLPTPLAQHHVNGYRVDFWFSTLGLVVETDGFGSHFHALQQTKDRKRDQAHTAACLTQLRFTHYQVRHEPTDVRTILARVAGRLELTLGPLARYCCRLFVPDRGRDRSGRAGSAAQHLDRRPVLRRHRDPAEDDGVGLRSHQTQVDVPGDDADHLRHLGLGECGTDAAADAAAERKPRVGLGFAVEEALRPEGLRFGIEVLAMVDQGDARIDLDS